MELDGTAAVVTGGASGHGEATARRLTKNGAKVVIADLQDDKREPLAEELGGTPKKTHVGATHPFNAPADAAHADELARREVELLRTSYMHADSIRLDAGIRMQPK